MASAVSIFSRVTFDGISQSIAAGPHHQRVLEVPIGDVRIAGAYFPLKPLTQAARCGTSHGPGLTVSDEPFTSGLV